MDNPYKPDLARFAVAFMRAVIAWNNAEDTARKILVAFGGKSIGFQIVSEHLSAVAVKDALNALCDALSDADAPHTSDLASHIAHFVEGMDLLRAYRNFYVHSLRFTGNAADDPTTFRGFLRSVEAKGRLAFIQQHLTTEELEQFMRHTLVLEGYGKAIARTIPGSRNALAPDDGSPPVSSLQKPPWPEKLKKQRSYLGEL